MTRVLFWKELREQWVIALALVLAGTGVLAVIALWQPFGSSAYNSTAVVVHKAMALFFAWGFGLVAGAQPFAGEREVGTLAWLDALPTNRHCLWIGKCLPTVLVVSVQVMALATVSACLGYTWDGRPGLFALLLLTAGFSGLASGLFGSTVSGSQLGALGWAVLAQVVVSIVAWQVSVAASWNRWLTALPLAWMVVPSLAILLIPVVISRHLFTRPDRNRWPARQLMTDPGNWMALSWLVWQQGRWPLLVALVIVAIIPFALPQFAPMYWPLIGLPLGVLCGVSTFAPDRLGDAHRFLGDRRLPLGQIWLVKVGLWLVVVTAAYVPLEAISPAFMRATGFQQPPMLGAYEVFRGWLGVVILALGPLYGFAIGQFCGLLCRKSAVAAALALLVAGALTVVWVPSMAAGGLHWWQWLGPPLVLIAATRLLMRPWVSGRLSAWPSVALVIASLLLAAAGVAVGLWYRVAEVPAAREPFDIEAFVAGPTAPRQREGGQKVMQALKQFDDRLASVDAEFRQPLAAVRGQPRPFRTEARETLRTGWPADAGRLNAWMDRLFAGEWLANLRAGVQSQLGYVESAMLWGNLWRFGNVEDMLCARALQLQSRGEHGAALDLIRVALDTTRFRRMRAGAIPFRIAADVEPKIFMVLTRWAAEVRDDEELLREALALVRDSDARRPPPSDMVKAEYVAVRDMLLALHGSPWAKDSFEQSRQLIWLAPWERARTMRVLNRLFADLLQRAAEPASMQASLITTKRVAELSSSSGVVDLGAVLRETELALKQTERDLMWRATQLQLALLLYERRHGQPAPDLNALVPELIPDLPRDPYGGGPFRYRVSAGEPITATSGRQDVVDQGRGIIWSVGPDLKDDGGMDHTRDQIFLVPRPVKR